MLLVWLVGANVGIEVITQRPVILDGHGAVLSKTSSPHRVVEIGKGYVIIDQMKNGGTVKLFLEGNAFYIEVKVGEYSYRDYFTRM